MTRWHPCRKRGPAFCAVECVCVDIWRRCRFISFHRSLTLSLTTQLRAQPEPSAVVSILRFFLSFTTVCCSFGALGERAGNKPELKMLSAGCRPGPWPGMGAKIGKKTWKVVSFIRYSLSPASETARPDRSYEDNWEFFTKPIAQNATSLKSVIHKKKEMHISYLPRPRAQASALLSPGDKENKVDNKYLLDNAQAQQSGKKPDSSSRVARLGYQMNANHNMLHVCRKRSGPLNVPYRSMPPCENHVRFLRSGSTPTCS